MENENSDYDYNGIYIKDPRRVWIDPNLRNPTQFSFKEGKHEGTVYEYSKFIKLFSDCNPNILEVLWRDEEDLIFKDSTIYPILKKYRRTLLSKKAKHTFSGYAFSQLKRIKGHNKWINNPQPKEPPKMIDFVDLLKCPKEFLHKSVFARMTRDYYKVYPADYDSWKDGQLKKNIPDPVTGGIDDPFYTVLINTQKYQEAKKKHEQYWAWKDNRNPTRSKLEEEYGYDTKHASHLIRLMMMGREILKDHTVNVKRSDSGFLKEIRDGLLTYKELMDYFEFLEKDIERLYNTSTLRDKVNPQDILDLNTEVYDNVIDLFN